LNNENVSANADKAAILRERLPDVSTGPGVYLLKDKTGRVIYVGKAANLRKRLASYFARRYRDDVKTRVLVEHVTAFDVMLTASDKEAIILEANLIKRHKPRYNVVLKDDKRYPILRLGRRHPYPRLQIVRKIKKDGARYFGPFASAGGVRQTLKIINKVFRLRKCTNSEFRRRARPCLHFQMKNCLGPCCQDVDPAQYDELVQDVILFLNGRTPDLVRQLRKKMAAAAQGQRYEEAALLRDKLFAVQRTLEKQVAVTTDLKDRDVIAAAVSPAVSVVTLLTVRGGFLQGTRHFAFEKTLSSEQDVIETFLLQYYEKTPFTPSEILVAERLPHARVVEESLDPLQQHKIRVLAPQRGPKHQLVLMALENARNQLREQLDVLASGQALLKRLEKSARLRRRPQRIECIDNAHLGGDNPVSGLVVFQGGRPRKKDYRTYRLRTAGSGDDYAAMAEVIERRFNPHKETLPLPDLLLIDGGRGQLGMVVAAARRLGLDTSFDILAIAKKDEQKGEDNDKIYQPGRVNPIAFGPDRDALLLLQRIRDEAHRFVLQFHRKQRRKSAIRSELDHIPGIGVKRRAQLLAAFGGIERIRRASAQELSAVPGMNYPSVRAVRDYFEKTAVGSRKSEVGGRKSEVGGLRSEVGGRK